MNHGLHYYQWQMYFVLKPCCMSGCNLYIHCMYLKQLKKYYLVTRQLCEIYHKLFTNIIVSMTRFCCCTPESYECLSRVLLDQICKKRPNPSSKQKMQRDHSTGKVCRRIFGTKFDFFIKNITIFLMVHF